METFAYVVTSACCIAAFFGAWVLVFWLSNKIDEQMHGAARNVVIVLCDVSLLILIMGSAVLAGFSLSKL